MVYHPDRILTPLKRTAGGFEEISLDQALDEIAARIAEVIGAARRPRRRRVEG